MVSASAGCFLASPGLLPAALAFPLAGVIRWRWKWALAVLLLCLAPLVIHVWARLAGRVDAAITSARWAMSVAAGLYFARRTGSTGLGFVLSRISRRTGGAGGLFGDAAAVILASGSLRRRITGGGRPGVPSPSRALELVSESVPDSGSGPPGEPPADGLLLLEGAAAWVFMLAGLAGC